ncbi:phage baseplate protein [bacterium]|nr:MAG: phage baseplate protein [bacterium]
MKSATKDFLGSGWRFPPRLDSRGQIELVHEEADIEEAIQMILNTRKGERPMRPGFGCAIHDLVFAPNDPSTVGLARRYVQEALLMWEPRIDQVDVRAVEDRRTPDNAILLDVRYRIVATNSARNLVFPFYTIPGGE